MIPLGQLVLLSTCWAAQIPDTPIGSSYKEKNICGQLALAAVADYLHMANPLERVFGLLPANGNAHTLEDLKHAAGNLGLAAKPVKWDRTGLAQLTFPAIIRTDPATNGGIGHFVVLLGMAGGRCFLLDLPNKPVWVHIDDLWRTWDGVALHLANSPSSLPRDVPRGRNFVVKLLATAAGALGLALIIACRVRPPAAGPDAARPNGLGLVLLSAMFPAIVAGAGLGWWSTRRAMPDAAPQLVLLPDHKEIRVRRSSPAGGEPVRFTYELRNPSTSEVVIGRIQTSCVCARPSLSSRRIHAGETVRFSVDVLLPKLEGRQTFRSILFVDQPAGHPPVVLGGDLLID